MGISLVFFGDMYGHIFWEFTRYLCGAVFFEKKAHELWRLWIITIQIHVFLVQLYLNIIFLCSWFSGQCLLLFLVSKWVISWELPGFHGLSTWNSNSLMGTWEFTSSHSCHSSMLPTSSRLILCTQLFLRKKGLRRGIPSGFIKHGVLENGPCMSEFPNTSSVHRGSFSTPCLITRGYP